MDSCVALSLSFLTFVLPLTTVQAQSFLHLTKLKPCTSETITSILPLPAHFYGCICVCFSEGERQDSSVFLDSKHLNPGLQLYRASYEKNLPKMAEALAHGADVNWANSEENKATPLIQAVLGVWIHTLWNIKNHNSFWYGFSIIFCFTRWVQK